jgi:hypothetical protein
LRTFREVIPAKKIAASPAIIYTMLPAEMNMATIPAMKSIPGIAAALCTSPHLLVVAALLKKPMIIVLANHYMYFSLLIVIMLNTLFGYFFNEPL